MPKIDIGNLRILLENETDDPQKVFFCPILGKSIDRPLGNSEHICPEALGENTWQILISREENEGFSKRFEQKFFSQPWINYGRQQHGIDGRRVGKKTIIDGYVREADSDKLNKLSIRDGNPEVHVVDTKSRHPLLDNAPKEMQENEELCEHWIPTPVPTILEATKIALEQLHWHKDTLVSNLKVAKSMREILHIKDVVTFKELSEYKNARKFGYTLFLNWIDPNPRAEDDGHFPMEVRFLDYREVGLASKKDKIANRIRANKRKQNTDQLFNNWLQDQTVREQNKHSFRLQVCPKDEFSPSRLEFQFDFADTAGGVIWFRLEPKDISVLGKSFNVTNLVSFNSIPSA